ncbi:MAG: response regulator transcription factor [Proteobacteria bacterium]|nr:response regulator transcription factor [Pseudomonadota bacterium]
MSERKSSSEPVIRVGVADKSPLVQAALTHLFAKDHRFELVDVWADGTSFLKSIERCDLNVVVTGWVISPGNGNFILDQLRAHANAPRIVVYTGAEGESVPSQVMAHGGAAFVSKREQPEYLLDTVAAVAQGRMVFPFLDVRKIHQTPLTSLTKRELEVLSALAAGQTNKQIAAAHGVSPNTVKFHIKNLFEKLDVTNRGQAIALYLKS